MTLGVGLAVAVADGESVGVALGLAVSVPVEVTLGVAVKVGNPVAPWPQAGRGRGMPNTVTPPAVMLLTSTPPILEGS